MKKLISIFIIVLMLFSISSISYGAVRSSARASSVKSSSIKSSSSSVKSTSTSTKSSSTSGVKNISGYKSFTPKYNSSNIKTEKINSNPVNYTNYSSTNMFTPNVWTAMWLFQCMHDNTEQVSEQDIAKELEERGYTQEEIDEILAEGRMAQEEDKQIKEQEEEVLTYILIGLLIAIGIFAIWAIVVATRY